MPQLPLTVCVCRTQKHADANEICANFDWELAHSMHTAPTGHGAGNTLTL